MPLVNVESLTRECDDIKEMLVRKNACYGNSIEEPIGIFYRGTVSDSICARIDEKLKRVANQEVGDDEDAELDLIGYLILKRILDKNNESAKKGFRDLGKYWGV